MSLRLVTCLAILVAGGLCLSPDGKCRVLAMKGGGVHGSYEAGVLKAFTEVLEPHEYDYDYVSGVSIGAINAAIYAFHEPGDEKAAVEQMLWMYETYLPKDLFSKWKRPFRSLFTKKSFMDQSNAKEVLQIVQRDRSFQRKLSFQSVDVQTGQLVVFDESLPPEEIVNAITSSGSLPVIFEAIPFEQMYLIDGGTSVINIALADPIRRCMEEEGVAPQDIIVDVIICQSSYREIEHWSLEDVELLSAWSMHQRREKITAYHSTFEDFYRVKRGLPDVQYRYVVWTTEDPPNDSMIPIFVTAKQVQEEIELGYQDGLAVIRR